VNHASLLPGLFGILAGAFVVLVLAVLRLSAAGKNRYTRFDSVQVRLDLILQHLGLEGQYKALLEARVRELARSGHKIEAIKLLREMNPSIGLKEAKDDVERLSQSAP
jgi:ribosomal protein L7/L12